MSRNLNMLAVDIGASNGRMILGRFDGNKITIEEVHRFPNQSVDIMGDVYWDILSIVQNIKSGLTKFKLQTGENIDSIGIDTWGVDFGLLDNRGQLIANPHSYRDPRVNGMIEKAESLIGSRELFDRTGISAEPFNTIYQLMGMVQQKDDVLNRAKTLLLIPDLLNYFLTGEIATEYTNATTTQLYNAHSRQWDDELIKRIDVPRHLFSEIGETGLKRGTIIKSIAEETGVGNVPVISVASHDTASAITAVPFSSDNCAFLSSGTWSILGVTGKDAIINDYTFSNRFMNEGTSDGSYSVSKYIMGLWIVQECKRYWDSKGEAHDWQELIGMAKKTTPFKAVINPTAEVFYGVGDMPNKIVRYCADTGQQCTETKGEIVRTVLEGLALGYRKAVEGIEGFKNKALDALNVVGGGIQNTLLNQFMADSINKPVTTGPVEGTALGNLMIQAKALSAIKSSQEIVDVIRNSFKVETYMPNHSERWDKAYQKLESLMENDNQKKEAH